MNRLKSPVRVSIDITTRCNLSCIHCRHPQEVRQQEGMEYAQIRALLDELSRNIVLRTGISGGEPFIRDDAPDILRYAARTTAGRVFVSTNGVLIDKDLLSELAPAQRRLTVKISLDGPPPVHDAMRGMPGAFEAAARAIRLCSREGFCVEVTTTLSRQTLPYLDDLARYVMNTGCNRYNIIEIIPVGSATAAMCLDRTLRIRAMRTLTRIRAMKRQKEIPLIVRLPFTGLKGDGGGCTAGTRECGILSDGSVVGCRLLPHIREGNILERSFTEIWSDPHSFEYFAAPVSSAGDPACRTCSRLLTCRGGCRAYAWGIHGNASLRDPRCPHCFGTGIPSCSGSEDLPPRGAADENE